MLKKDDISLEKEKEKEIKDDVSLEKDDVSLELKTLDSLRINWLSWLLIFITISIISYPNVLNGLLSYFVMFLFVYYIHYESHKYQNILTITHIYHHENNNFLSHFTQVLLEISCGIAFLPLFLIKTKDYSYLPSFLNFWVLIYSVLFYSTVHNINYGFFHVNNVHNLHHKMVKTNFGPDICDILFGTKNNIETEVENTNHYIPNILFSFFFVLLLQFLWKNDNNKIIMLSIFKCIVFFTVFFLSAFAIYLWFSYDIGSNKKFIDFLVSITKSSITKSSK